MAYVRENGHPGDPFAPGFGSWLSKAASFVKSAVSSPAQAIKTVVGGVAVAPFIGGPLLLEQLAAKALPNVKLLQTINTAVGKNTVLDTARVVGTGVAAVGAVVGGAVLAAPLIGGGAGVATTTSAGGLEAIDAAQAAASAAAIPSAGGLDEIERLVSTTTGSKATTVATPSPAALQASIFGTGETNTILIAGGIGLLALLLYGRK